VDEVIPFDAAIKSHQLAEYDGATARDEAINRLENRYPGFLGEAYRQLELLAASRETFTTDDLWPLLRDVPAEHRTIGAVILLGVKNGLITRTGETIPTQRPQAHRRWITVWKRIT
jgi:hypothetical protein